LIEREQHQSCGDKSDCIRKTHWIDPSAVAKTYELDRKSPNSAPALMSGDRDQLRRPGGEE
jgi:hypothetical protein